LPRLAPRPPPPRLSQLNSQKDLINVNAENPSELHGKSLFGNNQFLYGSLW